MLNQPDKPQDLRVRRTDLMLRKAFMELMAERDFQSITVQDIADRAMVNRATFYDHFVDKYALLEYSIREQFKETLQRQIPEVFKYSVENLELLIVTMYEYLSALRNHCVSTDQQILPMVQTQITAVITDILVSWLNEMHSGKSRDLTPPPLAATITSWAIYGAAFYGSQENTHLTSKEFVAQSLPAIRASLGQAFNVSPS